MARPKVKHRGLPPRMVPRRYVNKQGDEWIGYYYEHRRDVYGKRRLEPLGSDLILAKQAWARIEGQPLKADSSTVEGVYVRYMEWAENRAKSGLSLRTLRDRRGYWEKLKGAFGLMPIDTLLPKDMMPYLNRRSSKVSAKKELKFLSVLCNWARFHGYMSVPNPLAGVLRQIKVDESRDHYVEDDDLALVYQHAAPVVQDYILLMYLSGQRPGDVRQWKWSDIRQERVRPKKKGPPIAVKVLEFAQGKTGKKMRIVIAGEIAEVVARCEARQPKGATILVDPHGNPLNQFGYLRRQFDQARQAAAEKAKEQGIAFDPFQLRDMRPKAATDLDDIRRAQKLLGHTTQRMTAQYIRARKDDLIQPLVRRRK